MSEEQDNQSPPDTPPQSGATPLPVATMEEQETEKEITSTPPRPNQNQRTHFAELDTPVSGTALTTDTEADDAVIWKLPPPLTNNNNTTSTGGRIRNTRDGLSVTSSMYSVASGLVNTSAPGEDLAGLVVRMTPEEESSLITTNSAPAPSQQRKVASKTNNPTVGADALTESMQAMTTDLKRHLDKTLVELRDQSRRDFEKVLLVLQQESAKRTALEGRLHSQLLMQSETMVAMELKLLKLEAKLERKEAAARAQKSRPTPFRTIDETNYGAIQVQRTAGSRLPPPPRQVSGTEPTNIAVISSGASLASGVTAEGFMEDGAEEENEHSVATGDDDGTDDVANDGSDSTPQSRGNPFGSANLESILLNPMIGEGSHHGTSTYATRGDDNDGNSSLNTSVTNVTNSTLATATTRGESVNVTRRSLLDEGGISEEGPAVVRGRGSSTAILLEEEDGFESLSGRQPRSRSQSPLTIQSMASQVEAPSVTSASLGVGSILSNVAVAPPRSFGSRRAYAAATATTINMNGETVTRPLANRVVSFTTEGLQTPQVGNYSEAGDSITMPDELDNLSEAADTFATSARVWREEYEARLDALQKRWSNE
mmetsp:Transcript_3854/g.5892  ORF Transcript_3854/g.5892 Transcript_3854/m.5892 type:complete len:599 (-) Transcript_3854:150-1946(-)|eukprot:CAMPEP_0195298562 /NCGR_PEP_ID=MMETSP0707-20130614/23744_1 /TAXON_ID=33640 /ORGANISM="Asterionellopsis glacialis, Strain CCMP134" /LENGTH=598 /DNA_ID=CAMNT_0040360717 /DNA_START=256 /DNA_END=2052 /DNA_ORIENTATION=+